MAFRRRLKNKLKTLFMQESSSSTPTVSRPPPPVQVTKPQLIPPSPPKMNILVPDPELSPPPKPEPSSVEEPLVNPPINIISDFQEEWTNDYVSDDAPIRNAHYREQKSSSVDSFTIHITSPEDGSEMSFQCEPDEFILDAADRAGQELPFSCRSGGCLVCTGKLRAGQAKMEEQYVLEEEHLEQGYILLCCTTPQADLTIISHQEDYVD